MPTSMTKDTSCCAHSVARHAYNGCSECGCGMPWTEHPERDHDRSESGVRTFIAQRDLARDQNARLRALLAEACGFLRCGGVHAKAAADRMIAELDGGL